MQVILQISSLLRDVHATGYVHRDFKPSNILRVDDQRQWAMVGFDQAAAAGQVAPLSTSTLAYTAPEVLMATCEGDSAMPVSPAIDAWSLGVVVLELLLAEPAFPPSSDREEVRREPGSLCLQRRGCSTHMELGACTRVSGPPASCRTCVTATTATWVPRESSHGNLTRIPRVSNAG